MQGDFVDIFWDRAVNAISGGDAVTLDTSGVTIHKLIIKMFHLYINPLNHQRNRLDFVPNGFCPQLDAVAAPLQTN